MIGWQFQINEHGTTNLKQGWIQTKDVHSLYQDQMVFNNDDLGVALTKSQK
jgi:hypothetical protein